LTGLDLPAHHGGDRLAGRLGQGARVDLVAPASLASSIPRSGQAAGVARRDPASSVSGHLTWRTCRPILGSAADGRPGLPCVIAAVASTHLV